MSTTVALVVVATACVAAATHGYVFVRESVMFSRPSTQRMFQLAPVDVPAVRLWAFHQGIYNLLLGACALAGTVAILAGAMTVAATLVTTSCAFMIIAAAAFVVADPRAARIPGLLAQALPPAVALLALSLA